MLGCPTKTKVWFILETTSHHPITCNWIPRGWRERERERVTNTICDKLAKLWLVPKATPRSLLTWHSPPPTHTHDIYMGFIKGSFLFYQRCRWNFTNLHKKPWLWCVIKWTSSTYHKVKDLILSMALSLTPKWTTTYFNMNTNCIILRAQKTQLNWLRETKYQQSTLSTLGASMWLRRIKWSLWLWIYIYVGVRDALILRS